MIALFFKKLRFCSDLFVQILFRLNNFSHQKIRYFYSVHIQKSIWLFSKSIFSKCQSLIILFSVILSFYFNCQIDYRKSIFLSLISNINSRFYVKKGKNKLLVNLLLESKIKTIKICCVRLLV